VNEVNVFYTVFGLLLRSNLEIPGLIAEHASIKSWDVDIHLGASPAANGEPLGGREEIIYASCHRADSGVPALEIRKVADDAFLRMDYFDGIRFWLDPAGKSVWGQWPSTLSLEDAATCLLGPVLGFLLRLRGVTCLHASAVAIGEAAVAFAGSESAGKSTTAAALARRGHPVISDDIVGLVEQDGIFFVLPAYPYLSLWSDSVNMLYGPDKVLPSFSPSYDKRQLLLGANSLRFQEKPVALGAVFLLGERTAEAGAPFPETLTERDKLLALVANSYATNVLTQDMRAREFGLLGRLVATVPIWRLRPHQDSSQIGHLCDVIQEQCQDLRRTR
jgi:hypothetical protein